MKYKIEDEIDFENVGTTTYVPNDTFLELMQQQSLIDNWLESIGAIRIAKYKKIVKELKKEIKELKEEYEITKNN